MAEELATQLIHHPYTPPAGFDAPQPGVHRASTVYFADTKALRARDWRRKDGYTYGLHGTPTTFTLEQRIATLEGGTHCILLPSGLAAIVLVGCALLQQGDEVLIPNNAYGPTRDFARAELARWGITHRLYDPMDADALRAMISPATQLIWLEAAGSVTLEFPDLRGLLRVARERGITTALDNTWGAGVAFCGFDLGGADAGLGADIVMQALTKYPSGGGDVLMGSLVTRDAALHEKLTLTHMRMGWGIGANDAELVLRSLPTLALRYAAHDASARTLATWLAGRAEIDRVLHPALPDSPGHAHWRDCCTGGAAGLVSAIFPARYSSAQVDRFVDALKRFRIGFSWGGPVSLVVPYHLPQLRQPAPYEGTLVRLAIGLEAVEDLRADLEAALIAAFG